MLTLLLAVQQSVPRTQLGIATSLNQFFRSIGGAMGVAVMGALLTASFQPVAARVAGNVAALRRQGSAAEALLDPNLGAMIGPRVLLQLQQALAHSVRNIFILCTLVAGLALIAVFRLPRLGAEPRSIDTESGERAVMAELTVIDAEHEAAYVEE